MQSLGFFSRRTGGLRTTALGASIALGLATIAPTAPSVFAARRAAATFGTPRAVATADFDGDGVDDLAVGYSAGSGGTIAVYRGNADAIYPNSPEAQAHRASGLDTSAPFLADPTVYDVAVSPDLLAAGDVNNDGRFDLVAAAKGATSVSVFTGDENGSFAVPVDMQLDGSVTALAAGSFGLRTNTAVAVGVANSAGAHALVFASPSGAIDANAITANFGDKIQSLAFTTDAAGLGRLVVAAGSTVGVVGDAREGSTVEAHAYDIGARAVSLVTVAGGVAALDEAGAVHVLRGATSDAWVDSVVASGYAGSDSLVAAGADLAVLDATNRRLTVVGDASANKQADLVYELAAAPVAAAAMRLNADALPDFVTVSESGAAPTVTLSKVSATFTVTTAADAGAGSLRQAILDANATAGADTITFAITGGDLSIDLASALPAVTETVTIDATTQSGYTGAPLVELNGTAAGASADGILITTSAVTVRGLAINRFTGAGIHITTGGSNIVEACYIGVNTGGTTDLGNGTDGVQISGTASNRVGGTTAAARNVISGNGSDGVQIDGAGATLNTVAGNYIGTAATGNAAIANSNNGVAIGTAAPANTVGGAAAASQNVISGNAQNGVSVVAADATGTVIQNNRIGVNAGDTAGLANTLNGVAIASNNNAITSNRIASNGAAGVFISSGTGNAISQNSISGNGALGIDLAPTGVTPNDATDADTGANNLQNFPVLTSSQSQGTSTTVIGTLTSASNTTYRVEFFVNATCDASGNGEGMTFVGFQNVTTNATGVANINATLTGTLTAGQVITSTATDPGNNTSEFSACSTIATSADLSITKTGSPASVPTGASLTYTITVANAGPLPAQNVQVFDAVPSGTTFTSLTQTGTGGTSQLPPVNGTGAIILTYPTLAAGASITITVAVTVTGPAGLTITNTAFVQSDTNDPNPGNNVVTATTLVIAPPDIVSVNKIDDPGGPFRLKVSGTNFQPGIQVFIGTDTTPWPTIRYKDSTMLVILKGGVLKSRFPKNVPVTITVKNPDGGVDTFTYTR